MNSLVPRKHISLDQSLLGFGAKIINLIDDNSTLELLWQKCNINSAVKHSFDDLVLTLDFLYLIDVIFINDKGFICLN
jgi:hypothetical protein